MCSREQQHRDRDTIEIQGLMNNRKFNRELMHLRREAGNTFQGIDRKFIRTMTVAKYTYTLMEKTRKIHFKVESKNPIL